MGDTQYLPDTFRLRKVVFDEYARELSTEDVSLVGRIQFTDNNTKFSIAMGDLLKDGASFFLSYQTTYTPGMALRNRAKGIFDTEEKRREAYFKSASSNGTANGGLPGVIRILKVDEDNRSKKLKDAVFVITSLDDPGRSYQIKTDINGEAASPGLIPGRYSISETAAPQGYELNSSNVQEVLVSAQDVIIKTITNKRETIQIPVKKTWIGPKAQAVKVRLFADGQPTNHVLELKEADQWKGVFTDIPKYEYLPAKREIVYEVKEEALTGYTPEIKSDGHGGFEVTNKNVEKIRIPVTKKWIGSTNANVIISLKADGVKIKQLRLTAASGWQGVFDDLYKYDQYDGHLIRYEIEEMKISGYTVTISGDASSGFVVTNTEIPRREVPKTSTR